MTFRKWLLLLVVSLTLPATRVDAAEPASMELTPANDIFSILEEEQTVTTGSRVAVKASESPSSVWVIDRKMIESTAAVSIVDLLRRIPGLIPLDQTVGQSEIAVRGYGGEVNNRVLFMIDGRSAINDNYDTIDPMFLPVDIEDIERIEVLLGPASTLYGANAYSGVVNIITKEPDKVGSHLTASARGGAQWAADNGNGTSTAKLYGPQFLGDAHAAFSQALGDFRLRVSGGANYIDEPPQGSTKALDPAEVAIPAEIIRGTIDTIYSHAGWQLRGQVMATDVQSMYLATTTSTAAQVYSQDVALNLQAKRSNLAGSGDELLLQLWGRYSNNVYTVEIAPFKGVPSNSLVWSSELLGQYATPTFLRNRLLAGFQVRVLNITGAGLLASGQNQGISGVFVEDEFRPIDPLILTAGVRVEDREAQAFRGFSRLTAAPRGAIVFIAAPGHSIRAEFTTAFRDPSPLEQFSTLTDSSKTLTFIQPNVAVLPEQNLMGQLSYQGSFRFLKAHVEGFYGEKKGLISLSEINPPDLVPLTYRNEQETMYYGATAQLIATPMTNLDLWAQFNWYQAKTPATAGRAAVTYDSAPEETAGLGGSYTFGRWRASLAVYFNAATTQENISASTAGNFVTESTQSRLIINPMLHYAIDEARRFNLTLAGTNIGDIRFGKGRASDFADASAERIGPRVWLGFDVDLNFGKKP